MILLIAYNLFCLLWALAGDRQKRSGATSVDSPERRYMLLSGLMPPHRRNSCDDEANPPRITRMDAKNQKRIGYRVNGKNGVVKEHGSDNSTSGLHAKLNSQRKITMAEIIGTRTTANRFAMKSQLEDIPAKMTNAPRIIRIASHG
jgi:hypothetical protein